MEERQQTLHKWAERVLLWLTLLLLVYTLLRLSLRPTQPLILASVPETTARPTQLLDLNEATAEELECLPEIGPALAQRLLEHRETVGPFTGPEDVLAVSGIGVATYEAIRPYITFE